MKIIIAGIGKLGEYLASELSEDGNEVIIIDNKEISNKDIVNNKEVYYINGNALDSNILIESGIKDADLLISVMDKDENNIICSFIGKKLGVKRTIARVRTPEYSSSLSLIKNDLGLSMTINPEYMTAEHIARILSIPNALDTITFFNGKIYVVSFKIKEDSPLVNLSLASFSKKLTKKVIVTGIKRSNKIIIPKGNDIFEKGDKVYIAGTRNHIISCLKFAKLVGDKVEKIMISGGSSTGIYLAKMFIEMGMKVTIIEINEEKCKLLSETIPKALIVHGDASDQNLLYQEDIESFDSFISLNNIDEENIIQSMFAKNINVPNVITKVNHINLDGVVEKADIDAVVTPHKIASNQIVQYVKAMQNGSSGSCESIYTLDEEKIEMIEFNVKKEFKALNTKVKDIKLKDNVLITAILRGKNIIFPTGEDIIKINDIVVFTVKNDINVIDINDILE